MRGLAWGLEQFVGVGHLPDRCAAQIFIKGIGETGPEVSSESGIGGGAEVSRRLAASTTEQADSKISIRVEGLAAIIAGSTAHRTERWFSRGNQLHQILCQQRGMAHLLSKGLA